MEPNPKGGCDQEQPQTDTPEKFPKVPTQEIREDLKAKPPNDQRERGGNDQPPFVAIPPPAAE
jgi:hypothetical protein